MGSAPGDGNRAGGQALCDCGRTVATTTRPATASGPIGQSRNRTQTPGGGQAQEAQLAKAGQPSRSGPATTQGPQVFRLFSGPAGPTAMEPPQRLDGPRHFATACICWA